MAMDNQSLQSILGGMGTVLGGARQSFNTKNDFWKQNIAPWMDYYTKQNQPGNSYISALQRKKGAPVAPLTAPGDPNSPFAQFANAYYAAQSAPQNDEGIGHITENQRTGRNLNDLYMDAWRSTLDPTLQGIMGSSVAGKNYAQQHGMDPRAYGQNLSTELTNLMNSGYDIRNASGNTAAHIRRMAPDLARYGINSLSDLASYQVTNPYTGKPTDVFYNRTTGTIVPTSFGSSMKGEGGSDYRLKNINGQVVPVAKWRDTSEASDYAPLAMAASLALAPALGPLAGSLGGSLAGATGMSTGLATGLAQAGLSGLSQGALSAAMGGNFGQGFLGGALGSGITSGISSLGLGNSVANSFAPLGNTASEAALNSMLSRGVDSALAKGLSGAAIAGLSGGDVGNAGLAGALSGALSGGVGGYLQGMGANSSLANFAGSQLGKLGSSLLASSSAPRGQPAQQPSALQSGASPGNSAFGHSMGPLGLIAQARHDIGASGLGGSQQQGLYGGLDRLENRGRSQWGWTT